MWSHKHSPSSLDEFLGNKPAVDYIGNWLKSWKSQRRKALILVGSPGTGKTTMVRLFAKHFKMNIVETNASDIRSAKALRETFGNALSQQSLFYKGKIILFDEIDGLSGKSDRGAPAEIAKLVESSKHPVIMTANDMSLPKLRKLKDVCEIVKLDKVDAALVSGRLKEISEKEKLEINEKVLMFISRASDGDLKAAINDLQALGEGAENLEYASAVEIGYRDSEKSVSEVLKVIFKTENSRIAEGIMRDADRPMDELMQWIRENLPYEYKKHEDLSRAYEMLSRADIFNGRIRRQQYWRLLVYVSYLLSAGIATAKDRKYDGTFKYIYPQKIARLGRSRFRRAKEKAFASKLAPHLHCSRKVAMQYFHLLSLMEEKQPALYSSLMERIEA